MAEVLLYDYWRSSAAYRVRIGLRLLGLPFATEMVDLLEGAQRGADYLARNPQGLVPTLAIDGLTLTQSLAILEYLEETRGAGWLPAAPAERARVRMLAYAVAMDIHPVCNLRVARFATTGSDGAITTEAWMQTFIGHGLTGLEGLLSQEAETEYCCGARVSLADICLVPQVYNARRWNVDTGAFPRVMRIAGRLEALPGFAAAHPDRFRPAVPPPG